MKSGVWHKRNNFINKKNSVWKFKWNENLVDFCIKLFSMLDFFVFLFTLSLTNNHKRNSPVTSSKAWSLNRFGLQLGNSRLFQQLNPTYIYNALNGTVVAVCGFSPPLALQSLQPASPGGLDVRSPLSPERRGRQAPRGRSLTWSSGKKKKKKEKYIISQKDLMLLWRHKVMHWPSLAQW